MEIGLLQCQQCGGEIEFLEGGKSGKCASCGSIFYFSKEKTAEKIAVLNQASFCLRRNDFEGASLLYNDLIKLDETDSEAYWGIVLCTFGIEYVADSRLGTNVPTCRRVVGHSIFHDKNYLKAIEYAEPQQKADYRREAMTIDTLQQSIREKVKNEPAYDVFLCYKSSDDYGFPTEDRYIARKIHDELTARGIKTFYSEITLKDKLGGEFEPIIYKALYTAKVMILIATKEEYISAVWVRNEWTRFRDRIHDEHMQDAAFAVFKDVPTDSLPPVFRTQGVDLRKYPFGGFEIEIADSLAARLKKAGADASGKQSQSAWFADGFSAASEGASAHSSGSQQQSSTAGGEKLSKAEVIAAINKTVQLRNSSLKSKEAANEQITISNAAMKRVADQKKVLVDEQGGIQNRLSDSNYYKNEAKKHSNRYLWLRIALSICLLIAFSMLNVIVIVKSLLLVLGITVIWSGQGSAGGKRAIETRMNADRDREAVVREQIVQCDIQLASLNTNYGKAQKAYYESDQKLSECDLKLNEFCSKYSYAKEQIEKAQKPLVDKVADAASAGIKKIGQGIDKVVNNIFK